jgi:hypothetical protein
MIRSVLVRPLRAANSPGHKHCTTYGKRTSILTFSNRKRVA